MTATFKTKLLMHEMALKGIKVIEMLGLAPGPVCGTILAEFGASVVVVKKIFPEPFDIMSHGKQSLSIDLKTPKGISIFKGLCKSSDVLLDTFRPGIMEKLDLGPEVLQEENPRLVYARLTGYGQNGDFHKRAGHDINYVALSGILSLLGRNNEPPFPPINLLADFGGGSLMCALGIVMALYERSQSGLGQVVDNSMVEGTAYLSSWLFRSKRLPIWGKKPGENILDGGTHFYNTYKTKDDKYMAVGAIEPKFYELLLEGLNKTENDLPHYDQYQKNKQIMKEIFLQKTQAEWCKIFDNIDACVTPVVPVNDVSNHKHNSSRHSFVTNHENDVAPNPAPRLLRTPATSLFNRPIPGHGEDTLEILKNLNYSQYGINRLVEDGIVFIPQKSLL